MKALVLLVPLALMCSCASVRLREQTAQVVSLDSVHYETNRATLSNSTPMPFTRIQIREDYEMEKEPGKFACFRLSLMDEAGREVAGESYSAHYGIHVDAVDLDGDSIPEFVVQAHIGPATGPAIKELTVLRFRAVGNTEGFLETMVEMPCAGQAGPTVGWWYEVDYPSSRKGKGHDIRLVLEHDAPGHWSDLLPKDKLRVVSVRRSRSSVVIPGTEPTGSSNKPHAANSRHGGHSRFDEFCVAAVADAGR